LLLLLKELTVRFMDYFEGEQQSVILTEFLGGGELFEHISSRNYELTESKCRDFARQVHFMKTSFWWSFLHKLNFYRFFVQLIICIAVESFIWIWNHKILWLQLLSKTIWNKVDFTFKSYWDVLFCFLLECLANLIMTDTIKSWLEIIFLYIFVATQGQRLPEMSGLINPVGIRPSDPQISSQMPWPFGHGNSYTVTGSPGLRFA